MRPEIAEFAEQMEKVMKKHDATKGDSWKVMPRIMLWDKLAIEERELRECDENYIDPSVFITNEKRKKQLVDLANVCMILWNRIDEETPKVEEKKVVEEKPQ